MEYTPVVEKATLGLVSTIVNGKVVLTGTLTKCFHAVIAEDDVRTLKVPQ